MPETILRPIGIGDDDEWTLIAGATKFDACDPGDPINHDEDTTRCHADAGGGAQDTQGFTLTSMPGDATGVRNVAGKLRWRTPSDNNQTMGIAAKLNGIVGPETFDTRNSSASYQDFIVDPLPRPGGGGWTLTDLADPSLQIRGRATTNPTLSALRITSFWLPVIYDSSPFDLDPFREVAGRQIRLFQNTPETYQVVVPYDFLDLDVMDEIGLAHDSVARAASLLDSLPEHMLRDKWRRMYSQILQIDDNFEDFTLTLTLMNMEPFICLLWDTGSAPFDVNNDTSLSEVGQRRQGIAALSAGAGRTEERADAAFIVDSSSKPNFLRLAKVLDGVAKSNNFGTLSEDAIGNDVLNSCFIDDTAGDPDGWTLVKSTGSIGIVTTGQLFEDLSDYGQQAVEVVKGTGDTYQERSFTTTAVDRRICIWASDELSDTPGNWAYKRNNGDWWNDTAKTWGTIFQNRLLSVGSTWTRTISNVITGQGAGTGTLRLGFASGDLENDSMLVGQVMSYEDTLIYSDVLTNNTEVVAGGVADRIFDEIDNGGVDDRQVAHPERGTHRHTMRAYQDGAAAIEEGTANRHVLFTERWNADGDRDELSLEKVSGQVRLAYRRFISSAEDALTFVNITLEEGTEYEIARRWTGPSEGELGLPARTISLFVDGVNGVDAAASGVHSVSQQITQHYIGSTTVGIGLKNAANYLRNWELVQRVIPDEEILGRRP